MWPDLQVNSADLVILSEEIFNEKPHFLCSDNSYWEKELAQRYKSSISYNS